MKKKKRFSFNCSFRIIFHSPFAITVINIWYVLSNNCHEQHFRLFFFFWLIASLPIVVYSICFHTWFNTVDCNKIEFQITLNYWKWDKNILQIRIISCYKIYTSSVATWITISSTLTLYWQHSSLPDVVIWFIHFMPLVSFYTPWKPKKNRAFLI